MVWSVFVVCSEHRFHACMGDPDFCMCVVCAYPCSYRHATAFLSSHLGLCAAIAYGHVPHDWTMAIYQRGEALVSAVPWPPALRAALATEHGTLAMTVVWGLFTVGK